MTPEQRAREVLAAAMDECISPHANEIAFFARHSQDLAPGRTTERILSAMLAFAAQVRAEAFEAAAGVAQNLSEDMYETAMEADGDPDLCVLHKASAFACDKLATAIRALNPPLDAAP